MPDDMTSRPRVGFAGAPIFFSGADDFPVCHRRNRYVTQGSTVKRYPYLYSSLPQFARSDSRENWTATETHNGAAQTWTLTGAKRRATLSCTFSCPPGDFVFPELYITFGLPCPSGGGWWSCGAGASLALSGGTVSETRLHMQLYSRPPWPDTRRYTAVTPWAGAPGLWREEYNSYLSAATEPEGEVVTKSPFDWYWRFFALHLTVQAYSFTGGGTFSGAVLVDFTAGF